MKQKYAVPVLFALILASSLTSFSCYSATSRRVCEDMNRALSQTLAEQQCDVISQDTIRVFNSHLQIAALRGRATLMVDTRDRHFKAYAHCSQATIFSLSDQRPAAMLWVLTGIWAFFVWYRRRHAIHSGPPSLQPLPGVCVGGLTYHQTDGRFYAAEGRVVQLTPMQHQLLEMFFLSPSHSLSKSEICDALWPKKPDASETLYTLIRRLKQVVEQHSALHIQSDRGRSYSLVE